jgi:hypothetical protein
MANISTSLTQVVSSVKTAATAFTSGVSALPGGMNAIASVVNNAKGALNSIPSAGAVAGALGSVSGALGSLTGAAAKGLGALKAGSASLSALASTGLSPAAAAQLNSAIAALSSGGPVPIKLPTVATGTFDRGELTAHLASVFGSTKIPAFAAAGNPATFGKSLSSEQIKKYDETKVAISTATDEFFAQNITTRNAQAAYEKAKTELPQGDPQIEQMKAVFLAETSKAAAIEKKIAALRAQ